jgi:hypothetical protein
MTKEEKRESMQSNNFVSGMFRLVLMACFIVACEQGQESPSDTQTSPAPVEDTALPRLGDFQHEITLNWPLQSMTVGEAIRVPVTVKNTSTETWPTQASRDSTLHVVHFSYRWYGTQGNVVVADGHRTPFLRDINPGETVTLEATVQAPDVNGRFVLRLTLVQEEVAWFADAGAQPLTVEVDVVRAQEQTTAVSEEEESAVDDQQERGAAAAVGQEDVSGMTVEPQTAEVVQAPPVELTQESQVSPQTSQISQLLEQAQQQFQKKNLTTPKGDSALDTCLAILELAPGHPEALQLIQQMEQQYRDWAASSKNKKRRKTYTEKADSLAAVVQARSQ